MGPNVNIGSPGGHWGCMQATIVRDREVARMRGTVHCPHAWHTGDTSHHKQPGEVPLLSATFDSAVYQQETSLQVKTVTLTPVRQNRHRKHEPKPRASTQLLGHGDEDPLLGCGCYLDLGRP